MRSEEYNAKVVWLCVVRVYAIVESFQLMAARPGPASYGHRQSDTESLQDRKDGLQPVVKFLQSSLAMKSKVGLGSGGSLLFVLLVLCVVSKLLVYVIPVVSINRERLF